MRTAIIIITTAIISIGLAESRHIIGAHFADGGHAAHSSAIHSPYAGQDTRGIKALSPADIDGLLNGAGTPFGGMAKPAELNGYPGPLHVLEAIKAEELTVTTAQQQKIERLYANMKTAAVPLGEQIVAIEREIDAAFTEKTVTEEGLKSKISDSARLYEKLRFVHLSHHLQMVDVLTAEQVQHYNTLRGYTGDKAPCENVPAGHSAALWRAHNNCG